MDGKTWSSSLLKCWTSRCSAAHGSPWDRACPGLSIRWLRWSLSWGQTQSWGRIHKSQQFWVGWDLPNPQGNRQCSMEHFLLRWSKRDCPWETVSWGTVVGRLKEEGCWTTAFSPVLWPVGWWVKKGWHQLHEPSNFSICAGAVKVCIYPCVSWMPKHRT